MQLNRSDSIRRSLAIATCTLLGTAAHGARAQVGADNWRTDSSVLYYSEQDRVTVVEPVVFVRKQLGEESFLNFRLIYDSMTGSSPNGATPTSTVQTFTGASGGSSYSTPAGKTPLRKFDDQRVAAALERERPMSRLTRVTYGFNASTETDYTSVGASLNVMRDFNDKLTTLTTGISANYDQVSPQGGAPPEMELLSVAAAAAPPGGGGGEDEEEGEEGEGGETKTGVDGIIGVTQVLTRRALTQLNYTVGLSSGYLTDPYKVLSVVDATTGATLDYRYELRPDNRLRQSLYWKFVYNFDRDVLNLSYRYYWDDWDIRAQTVDLHYRWELWGRSYLQPHARWSKQTAADFYRHSLVNTEPVPRYASADYRLGEMETSTVGLKLGLPFGKGSELNLRAEAMTQSGDGYPDDAIGIQHEFDLFPTVHAAIYQITYTARF
jgi:hypothetical protein